MFGVQPNSQLNTKILGYRVSTSLFGTPVTIGLGTNRVPGNVVCAFDWASQKVESGGKGSGKGAGKGGGTQQYDYFMGAIVVLGIGPVTGISRIWQNKTVLVVSQQQATYTVPGGGGTFNPTNGTNHQGFVGDSGVFRMASYSVSVNDYGNPGGPFTKTGTQAHPGVKVSSSPGAGQYVVDALGNYTFSAADAGTVWTIGYTFVQGNPTGPGSIPIHNLNLTLFTGQLGQAPWSGIAGKPVPQIGYSEMAYVANPRFELGTAGQMPNNSYEVGWPLQFGGGIIDALTTDVIDFALTNRNMAGISSGLIDAVSLGKLANYCLANSLFISPLFDQQQAYASYLAEYLMIANAEIISSEGILKFGCYSEVTAVGNGATYTPATQPQFDLTLEDFIVGSANEPPISFSYDPPMDAPNRMSIEWTDRNNEYNYATLTEEDANLVAVYGQNPVKPITAHSICLQPVAAQVLNVQLKRGGYMLRKCRFTLGWKYALLEPMDVVTIPEQYPSQARLAARLLSIEEDDNGALLCNAEILLYGISAPTKHPKPNTGGFAPGFTAPPGPINAPVFFEATTEMTQEVGYELLIALAGGSPNWGGCSVWVSTDNGASYILAGKNLFRSNMGILATALPAAGDPDSTNIISVDLRGSLGVLSSSSKKDTDGFVPLALIDQELISYEYASLTGSSQYQLKSGGGAIHNRRGVFETVTTPHPIGASFVALDGNPFNFPYQQTDIGNVLFFKFTSFNLAGQMEEDIANVSPYSYRIHGPRRPYPLGSRVAHSSINPDPIRNGRNFGLQQTFAPGSPLVPQIVMTTNSPPNNFSHATKAPAIVSVTSSPTGGFIPGGTTVVFGLVAFGSDGLPTQLSQLESFTIPTGTNTNDLTINFTFADPANDTGAVYAATDTDIGGLESAAFLSLGSTSTNLLAVAQSHEQGCPDPLFDHYLIQGKWERHGGIWGGACSAVGTGTLTFAGGAWAVNSLSGRLLTLLATANNSPVKIIDVRITSNTPDTLTLASNISSLVSAGDVFEIRTLPDTFTATTFGDSGYINGGPGQPGTGLDVDAEKGFVLWIIAGTGSGQQRLIAGNTATVLTLSTPFETIPDATSIAIIVEPTWPYSVTTSRVNSSEDLLFSDFAITVDNTLSKTFVIQVLTVDKNGITSGESLSPFREIYQPGLDATSIINPGFFELAIVSDHITIDLANGLNQHYTMNQFTQVSIDDPVFSGGTIRNGLSFSLYIDNDGTDGYPTPAFSPTAVTGFLSNVISLQFSPDANTRTAITLTKHPDGWSYDTFVTGQSF